MSRVQPWIWFVACALTMGAIAVVLSGPRLPGWLAPLGAALVIGGAFLNASAMKAFRRHATSMDPDDVPSALVDDGPYGRTRNPMYVAGILVLAGLLLLIGDLHTLPVPVAYVVLVRHVFVPSDERRMAELFGDEWRAYTARVRRWL